jgi:AcrR family transcriptional regulator
MGRWEPDASARLRRAALELFLEQGFDQTTVADIAGRAGLTARTFFRYFADKREVLFNGSADFETYLVKALAGAPHDAGPLAAVAVALEAAGEILTDRSWAAHRYAVITANADLLERELIKMAALATALADGLRERGIGNPEAGLAAEAGVAVFRVAFERWVLGGQDEPGLSMLVHESFAQLKKLAAAAGPSSAPGRAAPTGTR